MTIADKIKAAPRHMTIAQVAAMVGTSYQYAYNCAERYELDFRRGKTLSKAKITELEAEAIRRDYRPLSEIAKDYGISEAQCCRIRSGKHWNDVDRVYFSSEA